MNEQINKFWNYLISEEKAEATAKQYVSAVITFSKWLKGRKLCKDIVREYKMVLQEKYTVATVNLIISALNSYFDWLDCPEYRVKGIKIQKSMYIAPNKDLTIQEYKRLVKTAHKTGKKRLCLIMQTIAATGIITAVVAIKLAVINDLLSSKSLYFEREAT